MTFIGDTRYVPRIILNVLRLLYLPKSKLTLNESIVAYFDYFLTIDKMISELG